MNLKIFVTVFGNKYEVGYPTVGQKFEIESAKILFSKGIYGQLAVSSHKTASELLDLIDAFSYFSVLIPEIKQKMQLSLLENLELKESKSLSKEFQKYYQFMNELEKQIIEELTHEKNKQ